MSISLRWQAAAFSVGAATIHFAEIRSHFDEFWLFGAFFFAIGWFQASWAVLAVAVRSSRLITTGVIVNLVVIAIWLWSRTAGLPVGPEAGVPEEVGAADLLATVFEGLLLAWAVAVIVPAVSARTASRRLAVFSTVIVWIGVLATTALVFFRESGAAVGH